MLPTVVATPAPVLGVMMPVPVFASAGLELKFHWVIVVCPKRIGPHSKAAVNRQPMAKWDKKEVPPFPVENK